MNEHFFDLRRNGLIIAVKAVIVVLFLAGLYSTASFSESTESAVDQSFSSSNDQNLYRLTDMLTDDDDFQSFRRGIDKVATVGNFYNALNESNQVTLISSNAQPVPISDFRGGENFDAWAESDYTSGGFYVDPTTGKDTLDVRSMQMNDHAFDFAHLTLQEGEMPEPEQINYSTGKIPVLLGANYSGVYELGDELEGQFYAQPFTFQVSGFLKSDSSMYYQNTINFFLDDYLIIPYPPMFKAPTEESLDFEGILSFQMINSDFAAPKSLSSDEVISHIDMIGRDTEFTNYALIGVPQYLTQFSLTRTLLIDNARLVGLLQLALGAGCALVLTVFGVFAYRRRRAVMDVRWKIGETGVRLQKSMASMVLVEWVVIAVLFALVYHALPNTGSADITWIALLIAVVAVTDIQVASLALGRHLYGKKEEV